MAFPTEDQYQTGLPKHESLVGPVAFPPSCLFTANIKVHLCLRGISIDSKSLSFSLSGFIVAVVVAVIFENTVLKKDKNKTKLPRI